MRQLLTHSHKHTDTDTHKQTNKDRHNVCTHTKEPHKYGHTHTYTHKNAQLQAKRPVKNDWLLSSASMYVTIEKTIDLNLEGYTC